MSYGLREGKNQGLVGREVRGEFRSGRAWADAAASPQGVGICAARNGRVCEACQVSRGDAVSRLLGVRLS